MKTSRLFVLGTFGMMAFSFAIGCGKPAQPPEAAPKPPEEEVALEEQVPESEELTAEERLKNLDLDEAKAIIAEIERFWPLEENDPLANPQSLEDVEAILKLDQVTLFPYAVDYVASDESLDAMALHGQIELAWGETYMLLMEILIKLRDNFLDAAGELEEQRSLAVLGDKDEEELDWLRGSTDELKLRIEALKLASIDHIAVGFTKAEEVIEKHPDSYLGYRLAADYYRTLRDWENFEAMVNKIRETNPKSNGLLFLLAAAAYQTEKDRQKAEKYYHQALKNDPEFVRAQAHLLMIQETIDATHAQLLELEKRNPHHQFVALAGEAIKKAFIRWKLKKARAGGAGAGLGAPEGLGVGATN